MTDKTKMSNLESYTELSIQIATLDMKLDAILKLLNKPEIETQPIKITAPGHYSAEVDVPPQWPNESHTNYLKRIGQYAEAYSDNEKFDEEFK
jgi:hypothetical protein